MKTKLTHTAKALLFVLILLILMSGASQIVRPKDNTEEQWKHDSSAYGVLGEPENTVDVLLIGDSELYSSIIPLQIWDEHGYTSFNCGSKTQSLWYSIQFLLDAFERQTPKIVVLETNTIFRYFTVDNILLHSAEILFPVLKYHDRWKIISFEDMFSPVDYKHLNANKGFLFNNNIDPAQTDDYMTPSGSYKYITPVNRMYIRMIESFCSSHGAKLVLMSTPSTKNWNMARHNSIERFAKEIGVDYIDMNTMPSEVPIDWDHDTRDMGDHLNIYGAEKATAYLGKYLEDTGLLTDHKDDPACKGWNKALAAFVKKYRKDLSFHTRK